MPSAEQNPCHLQLVTVPPVAEPVWLSQDPRVANEKQSVILINDIVHQFKRVGAYLAMAYRAAKLVASKNPCASTASQMDRYLTMSSPRRKPNKLVINTALQPCM